MESRIRLTIKNAFFAVAGNMVNVILSFVSRTIFISFLGTTLLGIEGLFTNVLTILSFTELGIGIAMNYYLYKPVADGNIEKTKSLMRFYKTAYRAIALIVLILGLVILMFLDVFVHNDENIPHLKIYYLIYLFNTVTSYLATYKYSIINAQQKSYVLSVFTAVFNAIRVSIQIAILLIMKSFMTYLIVGAVIELIHKFAVCIYINKKYPELNEKGAEKLPKHELRRIWKDVRALILHKIGEMSVYQTDNIIISSFISVAAVGMMSNYNMIISTVTTVINLVVNAVVPSLGNMVATEDINKRYDIFKKYRFAVFWLYGFSSIAFFLLLTPFVTVWIGSVNTVSTLTVLFVVLNFYMVGHRLALLNLKVAAGIFKDDQFISLLQGVINFLASIYFVKKIGLPGVFLGTVIQGLFSTIIRPIIIYKKAFKKSCIYYFMDSCKYFAQVIIITAVLFFIKNIVMADITPANFTVYALIVGFGANAGLLLLNIKSDELKYFIVKLNSWRKRRNA